MTSTDIETATVATGVWQYDGHLDEAVRVVALPFDYWHAMAEADQQLEPGEEPEPKGDGGLLYYAYFTQIDGPGFPTIIQAKGFAQSKVRSEIRWN